MKETVSIIITVLNGEQWIDNCFSSIVQQNVNTSWEANALQLEICVFDDASTDNTRRLLEMWKNNCHRKWNIDVRIISNFINRPKGVGYGRNMAIQSCSGNYLCFQDIDDEMLPNRIIEQYKLAKYNSDAIIGSKFIRNPEHSTYRFSAWANEIDNEKLESQIYTSNGPTIVMPTWFCHKSVYNRVGGFCEDGKGTPEDLIFFYKHLDLGGKILRVNQVLLVYQYHLGATTFSITEETIWKIRFSRLVHNVLNKNPWASGFTIWNAGKQGRKFFRDLPNNLKSSVKAFCDVDKKKINKFYDYYDETKRKVTHSVPIIHFTRAKPPIIICIKLNLTNGVFEKNLESLNLKESNDYVIFS